MLSVGGLAGEAINQCDTYRYRNGDNFRLLYAIKKGIALLEANTPGSYKEAITGPDGKVWIASMERQIKACEDKNTWTKVLRSQLPKGTNIIKCKWVYKIKLDEFGEITEHKSRITPKGFMQKYGIDYNEVFAATGQYKTMRLGLSLTASYDNELDQLDVPSAFLNAELNEDIYMEMPEGFAEPDTVVKLNKALYGLKQAPREWHQLISKYIIEVLGFKSTISDPCFFFKKSKTGKLIMMFLFVDDFQVSYHATDATEWCGLKQQLIDRFDTKDMGASKWILGMHITRDRKARTIKLDHELYISKALEKFGLAECKPASTPERKKGSINRPGRPSVDEAKLDAPCDRQRYMELIGTLLYPSISTRLDIAASVRSKARHMQDPRNRDMLEAETILRYLSDTKDIGLWFGRKRLDSSMQFTNKHALTAYGDADWANDRNDRKSITGWIVKLNDDVISWASKKQHTVSQSTCEAELYAEAAAVNEILWMRGLLNELGLTLADGGSVVYCDNQPTLNITKNGIKSERTKHVDVKYHFVTEKLHERVIDSRYLPTDKQQADILTKPLEKPQFESFRKVLMTR